MRIALELYLVFHSKAMPYLEAELLPHAEASEALLRKVRSDCFKLVAEGP
jgi:hypothetical protein